MKTDQTGKTHQKLRSFNSYSHYKKVAMQQDAVLSWKTTKLTYKFSPSIHCVFLFVLIVCVVVSLTIS